MRIFFIGEGRLGNQVFQYAALSSLADPDARLTAIGLEDIETLFELRGPGLTVWRGGLWLKRLAKYLLAPLLRTLARHLRVFSYACEPEQGGEHRGKGGLIELRQGLWRGFLFVDGGYYQSSEYWGELFPPRCLELRAAWRARGSALLAQASAHAPARSFFLHLRRGDYLQFSTYGVADLQLPSEFFRRAIREFQACGEFNQLVIVTDDPGWARSEFADVANMACLSNDAATDFAVMAQCSGGIVSNSSFSLAAALFMRKPALVIAPEYWFGFRVRQWLPPRIRFDHPRIAYREVLSSAPT